MQNISRVKFRLIITALLSLVIVSACERKPDQQSFEFSGQTMGTYYRVSIIAEDTPDMESLQSGTEQLLALINSQMSTYIEDSQISQFNNLEHNQWFEISVGLARVSHEAKQIYLQSKAAYDPTVAPLVNLWSFGPDQKPLKAPSQMDIKRIKPLIGADKFEVRDDPPALKKSIPGLMLDLSSIAKGYAVDQIAQYLDSKGHRNFLIDIGGELRAAGEKQPGQPWRVAIEKPDSGSPQSVQKIISISDKSIATSGSYRNYFEQNGIRYSHIINPTTGRPIDHKLVSVSVVAHDCMTADGYATALMVMGPDEGYEFALQYAMAVYMIERKGNEFISKFTPQMKPFLE